MCTYMQTLQIIMYRSFILVIVCFSIVATTEANSKVLVSDCGDRSHLLHFKRIAASDLIRGKDVTIDSEKELLTANITSGTVDFECLRDDVFDFMLFYIDFRLQTSIQLLWISGSQSASWIRKGQIHRI